MSWEIQNTEKCGVIGTIGARVSVTAFKRGFLALQHRGADAAGLMINQDHQMSVTHHQGEIGELFSQIDLESSTTVLIGHNRYATSSGLSLSNAQPFFLSDRDFSLALAHNGNIPEEGLAALKALLVSECPADASDSYVMAKVLLEARPRFESWSETMIQTLPLFEGAFSLVCSTEAGDLFGIRDPWGIRPLCLGSLDQTWVVASESVALDAMGAHYHRELLPGEMLHLTSDGQPQAIMYAATSQPEQRCALESIYFAKNQSFDGRSKIFERRRELGRLAGRRFLKKHIPIDLVIPILNSGKEMSLGVSEALNMANTAAIRVRGKKRSFIQSDDNQRQNAVHQKHIVDGVQIKDQRILLCDDSLVRGTSLKGLINKIKELENQQPAEIHLVLGSEPVVNICDLGVDLPTKKQLLASRLGGRTLVDLEKKVAHELGIKSVTYLDRQSVETAFGQSGNEMCWHCFGGPHPIHHRRRPIYRAEQATAARQQKIVFMASGSGTHVYNFLRAMTQGVITAQPLEVITNIESAGVIQRAATFNVPVTVLPSKGTLNNPKLRQAYEASLLRHLLSYPFGPPDVVVLAGWMMVLSDVFLEPLAAKGVMVINIHPALLSGTGQDQVMTSKGLIPELRGAHAIADTITIPLSKMPIAGSTVHQVSPRTLFDTGKIIIKTEVPRFEADTETELTQRIKAAEYLIYSLALQKTLLQLIDQPLKPTFSGVRMHRSHQQVAVLGNGGRESAFVRQLLTDPLVDEVHVFDWNASFSEDLRVIRSPIHATDISGVVTYCRDHHLSLVISGAEQFAENGTTDALRAVNIPVLGASQKAIQIEADKAWARQFMKQINLPQPLFEVHTHASLAKKAAQKNKLLRVVKASGLCGGKGVIICDTYEQTAAAIDQMLTEHHFGTAGNTILLEERLGWQDSVNEEVSVMYYCDGQQLLPLPLVQDYKREFDGDQGKNTGSMGCHTAPESLSPTEQAFVRQQIAEPLIQQLAADGSNFVGILYVSLMKTSDTRFNPHGLFVIEINGRGGDPETIVQLAAQHHPHVADFYLACATGQLARVDAPTFDNRSYVNVVLAASNYPDGKSQGKVISGLEEAEATTLAVLHAGTKIDNGQILTNGGRILDVVGSGETLAAARKQAYAAAAQIHFNDQSPKYRSDIAAPKKRVSLVAASSTVMIKKQRLPRTNTLTSTRIEVYAHGPDMRAKKHLQQLKSATGGAGLKNLVLADVYTVTPECPIGLDETLKSLFTNPITQRSVVVGHDQPSQPLANHNGWVIEIGFLPGVTDNVGETAREMIAGVIDSKLAATTKVYSSQIFFIEGKITRTQAQKLAAQLHNPLIQEAHLISYQRYLKEGRLNPLLPVVTLTSQPTVSLVDLHVSDQDLILLGQQGILNPDGSRRGPLALDQIYMRTIREYFDQLGRSPTDIELESIAQTWSEHCKHTIFADPLDDLTEGLYRTYIKAATNQIRAARGQDDICVSVFSDNAGAIVFNDEYLITDKVETHNSPSALDPFGGAITGIVGVNRDALGFGLGAKPILNRFGFCLADPHDQTQLYRSPDSSQPLLSAQRIFDGVVAGVNSGGNCSGIPTPIGFLNFDHRFRGKPLVFVGTVGLMPRQQQGRNLWEKQAQPGDLVVMLGGRVGIDGIHGATFSSEALTTGSPATAVQIGDPITQKKLSDALIKEARDLGLYTSITDNGAGGLSCSVAEMARESGGFVVNLDTIPLKYPGLEPWQIWISESQERMTLSVAPEKWSAFEELMKRRGVEATVIGTFTDSGKCIVTHHGDEVMNLDMDFLHDGLPPRPMRSQWQAPVLKEPKLSPPENLSEIFTSIIGRLNLGSIEKISRQYDHEVQATSVIKPLQGKGRVNGDAAVIKPLSESVKGVVVSHGLYPSYSDLDPYAMAAASIDTAIRNAVVVGADLSQLAILDNFCWCSAPEPTRLGQLKLAAQALHDTAIAFQTPIISGKDSMFNDFKGFDDQGQPIKISIPPTLLISSIGVINDVTSAVSLDAKFADDLVYVLGDTHDELAGSEYYDWWAEQQSLTGQGAHVPQVDPGKNLAVYQTYHQAVAAGLVASAIGIGRGGLAVALGRMALGGQLGLKINLSHLQGTASRTDHQLFSESQGRIVATVSPQNQAAFEKLWVDQSWSRIGRVTATPQIEITDHQSATVVSVSLKDCRTAYTHHFGIVNHHQPAAAVLTGYGINCEEETATAFQLAGADPTIVHINDFIDGRVKLSDFQILAIPGGFSFGDDTGSGNALAQKMKHQWWHELRQFITDDHLVIGICNGFQVLTNLGLLPALGGEYGQRQVALIHNDNATYTDRWVDLDITSNSPWLTGITQLSLPIAHGEGKFYADAKILEQLQSQHLIAARYTTGEICRYQSLAPNPNGSLADVAALTDVSGRILGIMPHPERALNFTNLPHWPYLKEKYQRAGIELPTTGPGLKIFQNAVNYFT